MKDVKFACSLTEAHWCNPLSRFPSNFLATSCTFHAWDAIKDSETHTHTRLKVHASKFVERGVMATSALRLETYFVRNAGTLGEQVPRSHWRIRHPSEATDASASSLKSLLLQVIFHGVLVVQLLVRAEEYDRTYWLQDEQSNFDSSCRFTFAYVQELYLRTRQNFSREKYFFLNWKSYYFVI